MNKNIIAVAVAASLAMPVVAAADMQIIGQAQLEIVNTSTGGAGNPVNEGLSLDDGSEAGNVGSGNASALGIAGSQELGNGLTGLYKINLNFQADDGAGAGLSRSRDMYLGLKGDFGTVMAGRMNSPYKSSTALWDPLYATFMQARGSNGMSVLHNGYINNSIGYANKFGEANIAAAIAFDEDDNDTPVDNEYDGDHAFTASLNMPVADTLELAVAFLNGHGNVIDLPSPANASNGMALKVGLKWTTGDIIVAGQYETLDNDLTDTSNLYANISMALDGRASIVAAVGIETDESAGGNNDGTYTTLAYKRTISKSVSAHAGIVMIDEGAIGQNNDATQIGAGVRVQF